MSYVGKDDCIVWNKCNKGLLQASRQHYKKAVKILKSGFIGDNDEHCLYVKKSEKSILMNEGHYKRIIYTHLCLWLVINLGTKKLATPVLRVSIQGCKFSYRKHMNYYLHSESLCIQLIGMFFIVENTCKRSNNIWQF